MDISQSSLFRAFRQPKRLNKRRCCLLCYTLEKMNSSHLNKEMIGKGKSLPQSHGNGRQEKTGNKPPGKNMEKEATLIVRSIIQ